MKIQKQEVLELLEDLPDEFELEEVMYRLYFRKKLTHALEDFKAGRAATLEDALKDEL